MIRAILWKEYREQGPIALALLVVGGGLLAAAAAFAAPPVAGAKPSDALQYLGTGRLATIMLAVTAGIVTGGALFAAEREAGTFKFLDAQPGARRTLWQAKIAAGACLTIAQIVVVLLSSAALGLVTEPAMMRWVAADALLAFAWGAFGSTFARTTLGSVGIAIPFGALFATAFAIPTLLLFGNSGGLIRGQGSFVLFVLLIATPLAISALAFGRIDHVRAQQAPVPRPRPRGEPGAAASVLTRPARTSRVPPASIALAWMTARQLARPCAVLSLFALFFGFTLLLPGIQSVFYWPLLALSGGVVVGVLTFAPEQGRGDYRFWSEARLPLRGLWSVKIALHLLLLAWLLALLALPGVARAQFLPPGSTDRTHTFLGTAFHTKLFDELGLKTWFFLLAPAAYGFAAGHVSVLLFRKAVVAAGVAGLTGGSLALFLIPSLLSGGVAHWQVWSAPLTLLLLGALLVRPWAQDRLLHRRAAASLVLGIAAAVLLMGAGLLYRIHEVPLTADPDADLEFVGRFPPLLDRSSGREFQGAVAGFMRAHESMTGGTLRRATSTPIQEEEMAPRTKMSNWPGFEQALEPILLQGWTPRTGVVKGPGGKPFDVEAWLNGVCEARSRDDHWCDEAARAAKAPPGIYWDPRQLTSRSRMTSALDEAVWMSRTVLARGLQKQAQGDEAAFLEDLAVALALTRSMGDGSIVPSFLTSLQVERAAALATNRWLERLSGSPELLRRARDLWLDAENRQSRSPVNCYLAERYLLREQMAAPSQWLSEHLSFPGSELGAVDPVIDLISTAWSVPWERERTRRLLGLTFNNGRGPTPSLLRGRPGAKFFSARRPPAVRLLELDRRRQTSRRVLTLKIALMLHEASSGRPAISLDELLASGSLREIPLDPYTEKDRFQYRLSDGRDSLVLYSSRGPAADGDPRPWSGADPGPSVTVAAGQGIVWSVGPNRINADGRRLLAPGDPARLDDDDLLDVVPRISKQKPSTTGPE